MTIKMHPVILEYTFLYFVKGQTLQDAITPDSIQMIYHAYLWNKVGNKLKTYQFLYLFSIKWSYDREVCFTYFYKQKHHLFVFFSFSFFPLKCSSRYIQISRQFTSSSRESTQNEIVDSLVLDHFGGKYFSLFTIPRQTSGFNLLYFLGP